MIETPGVERAQRQADPARLACELLRQLYRLAQREPVGVDLDGLDEEGLRRAAGTTEVYARVTPAHKLRIVEAMQAEGHVAAMTGDGVNDAPAIKAADIGVAMGQHATDVTREAAGMVIYDGSYSTIVDAIAEGRTTYQNIKRFILFLFTVKTYDTEAAAASLKPVLRPGATVLTLQNGIDNHERIDAVLGDGVALPGTIRIETTIAEPGVIAHTSKGHLIRFGELGTSAHSERVDRLATAFSEAGLTAAVPQDMRVELWDNARVTRDKDEVRGSYIQYDQRSEFFSVSSAKDAPGSRVRAVIQPKKPEAEGPPPPKKPAGAAK